MTGTQTGVAGAQSGPASAQTAVAGVQNLPSTSSTSDNTGLLGLGGALIALGAFLAKRPSKFFG